MAISTNSDNDCTQLWHMRLGHIREKSFQALTKQDLLKSVSTCKLKFCKHWVIRKKTKVRFGTATHCTKGILDYFHADAWGPTKTVSIGGIYYFVFFIDDYSRRCWVYTMKHKWEVLELFVEWKKNMEKNTGRKIKVLRSNGGEYTSDHFLQLCRDEGIERYFTVRETPNKTGWLKEWTWPC